MFDAQTVFLVVDDFEPMRRVTANQLRGLGAANVLTAGDGAEALRLLRLQPVDVVLSDLNMPVMNGLELLRELRADPRLQHLPFVMITAEAQRSQVEQAIACGVNDVLLKPYTLGGLAQHVEHALGQRRRGLPAPRPAPALPSDAEVAREDLVPTILIVDDTQDNLLLLSRLFKGDYRVRLALNGEKALRICQSDDPPDLLLLDVMMPDMDGFEVLQRLREHPSSENIPVIFVTAMTGEQARSRGLELGAVDFVTKPVDPSTLKLRVRNFMRYIALHKQLQASYDDMLDLARMREQVEQVLRHDIKGPLAGVLGMVQSLLDKPTLRPDIAEPLRAVEETTLQVLDLFNLSAELQKIETGRYVLHAEPVDVTALLKRTVAVLAAAYRAKNVRATVSDGSLGPCGSWLALGDPTLCHSLFSNLLKNAFEAAPDGSAIKVRLSGDAMLRVEIENRGVVPAAIRARFFERHVTAGKPGGTGLGTYSARKLAQAQGGDIALDVSDAENRTRLTVTLPRPA